MGCAIYKNREKGGIPHSISTANLIRFSRIQSKYGGYVSAQISKDGKGIPGGACGRDAQRESAKEKRDVSMATNRPPVIFRDRERQIWALDGSLAVLSVWTKGS